MSIKKYLEKIKKLLFPYSPFKKYGKKLSKNYSKYIENIISNFSK